MACWHQQGEVIAERSQKVIFDEIDQWSGALERGDDQTLVIIKSRSQESYGVEERIVQRKSRTRPGSAGGLACHERSPEARRELAGASWQASRLRSQHQGLSLV